MESALGLFGGTFDPVHYGHLRAADDVRKALDLGELRLLPAGDPPHRSVPGASAAHRLAMLKLAIEEFPGLAIDAREMARTGKSYTLLTLQELRAESPQRPLVLVVGADAFAGLPAWHRWNELFDLAHLVVVTRPGTDLEGTLSAALDDEWTRRRTTHRGVLETRTAGAILRIRITPQPISATAIRQALSLGPKGIASVRGLLPAAVLAYIERNQLYAAPPDAT